MSQRTEKQIQKLFVKSLKQVAKKIKKSPSEVTKSEFIKGTEEKLTDWELRKAGGYQNLRNMFFPSPAEDLIVKYGGRAIKSHQSKLEKAYGSKLHLNKALCMAVTESIAEQPVKIHKPLKPKASAKKKTVRTLVAKLSDTHYGCNINNEEMRGVNEYNWLAASRRTALFCKQIVEYKEVYRDETDLVLQINGDIIAGIIHDQEWGVDVITEQVVGAVRILTQAVSYLAQNFKKVKVVCTPGNHGRVMHKANKGRQTSHKWDSFETIIHESLKAVVEAHCPNVEFDIPVSGYALYKIQGHYTFQTHGDTIINVGNPGKSISMKSINDQLNSVNVSGMVPEGEQIKVLCVGHVHVPTVQSLQGGGTAVINGTLSGLDAFAQAIGIFSSNPTQVLYECTKAYPVGDIRFVQVARADKDSSLDKIIEPYKRKLKVT